MNLVFALTIQIFVGLLLLLSAVGKLRRMTEFESVLGDYRLLPEPLVAGVARGVAGLELVVAAGLLVRVEVGAAALLGVGLLVAFGAAIALNLARGRREIDCGCHWGASGVGIAPWMVLRNLGIAAALGATAAGSPPLLLGAPEWLGIVCASCIALFLYHALPVLSGDWKETRWIS